MPRKRSAVGRFAQGFSQGIPDLLGLLLQSKLIGDRQQEQMQTLLTGQTLDDVRERLKAIIDPKYVGEVGPERASAAYDAAVGVLPEPLRGLLGDRPDFGSLDTSHASRLGTLTEEVAGITNPDDLRLTAEGLRKRAPGLRVDPTLDIPNLLPGSAGLPSGAEVTDPAFRDLVESAEAQREGLLAKEERTPTPYIDEQGNQFTGFYTNRELGGLGALQTERTAQQEGERQGTIAEETAIGEERGLQATEADRTARQVREFDAMTPAEMRRFAQEEAVRLQNDLQLAERTARLQLETAGQIEEAKALRELTTAATVAMSGLEEMAALATEVNAGWSDTGGALGAVRSGGMDLYAGIKQAMDTLPYVGTSLSAFMTSLGAAGTALSDALQGHPDPVGVIRKIMRLQGMRREQAVRSLRAAGDDRPSDADVAATVVTFPGPFESAEQTADKIQFMTDRTRMIPDILKEQPHLRGFALLEAAGARARERAAGRAGTPPTQTPPPAPAPGAAAAASASGGLSPTATSALEIIRAR